MMSNWIERAILAEAALVDSQNLIVAEVDIERRRWYAALAFLGDLEGLAPEVVGKRIAAEIERLRSRLLSLSH